jgi:hypothetical protein
MGCTCYIYNESGKMHGEAALAMCPGTSVKVGTSTSTVSVSPTDVSEVSFRYLCVSASSVGFLTLKTRMVLTCCTCCWFSFSSAGHIPPTHWLLPLRHSLESPCVTKVPLSEFDASLVFADNYLVCFEGLYNVAPTTC